MTDEGREAGFSMVELLVVLAVVAGLSALAAMSLRPSDSSRPTDLRRFMAEARSAAILSGRPVAITVEAGRVHWAKGDVELSGRLLVDGRAAAMPYQIVAYPDGSYSGGTLTIQHNGIATAIDGVYRESSR